MSLSIIRCDTIDELRAEIAHFLDHGTLKPGSSVANLRTLAVQASGRPGSRSIRELDLNPATAPDWYDAINKIDYLLTRAKVGVDVNTCLLIDCANDGAMMEEYDSSDQMEAAQERRAAARARAAKARAEADAQADTSAMVESAAAPDTAQPDAAREAVFGGLAAGFKEG